MPAEKVETIRCSGCGQVGRIVSDPRDEFGGRRRRLGFYLHRGSDGVAVIACCKCQQTQPCTFDSL